MKEKNVKYEQPKEVKVHPVKDGRRVPLKQLRKKLDIDRFEQPTPPYTENKPSPNSVKNIIESARWRLLLSLVGITGQPVKKGELVGQIEDGKLGAPVHASISGTVTHVSDEDEFVRISKKLIFGLRQAQSTSSFNMEVTSTELSHLVIIGKTIFTIVYKLRQRIIKWKSIH